MVETFGSKLRRLRTDRGWRQQDLADALEGEIGRSTIANLEGGREPPTPRVLELLAEFLPEWDTELRPLYLSARATAAVGGRHRAAPADIRVPPRGHDQPQLQPKHLLAGPYVVERLQLTYVFRHSRSPEEIIEVRTVRATRAGATGYGLKLEQTKGEGFRVEEEPLWGGDLVDTEHIDDTGHTVYLRRMEFGHRLRKGQRHEFAVRSWVEKDPQPDTVVQVKFSVPCRALAIHLNFRGPDVPTQAWAFGPIADDALVPTTPMGGESLTISTSGLVSKHFTPDPANEYGIAWKWE